MGPMIIVCKTLRCLNWVTKLNCLWGCGLDFSDRMEASSGPLWVLNETPSSFCSSSTSFPSPSPLPSLLPQTLQSVLNLGFQCNLPLFPTISDNCLHIFYFHCIEILFFFVPLFLPVLPIFLVPSIISVAICFDIRWFCILSTSEPEEFHTFYDIFPPSYVSYTVRVHTKFILLKWENVFSLHVLTFLGLSLLRNLVAFLGSKEAVVWKWLSVFELQDEESREILHCSRGLHGTVLNAHVTAFMPMAQYYAWHSTMHMSQYSSRHSAYAHGAVLAHIDYSAFVFTFPKKTLNFRL